MRVAHFVPAYRQQVHVEVAMAIARDAAWCESVKWTHMPFFVDATGIARARNLAVKQALEARADLLLMQDADVFALPPQTLSALRSLWKTMHSLDAAVVGAAVIVRNGEGMNCEPAKPGELYEGVVGTGLMLIDLRELRELALPWFVHRDDPTGTSVETGEDIYFCRHVAAGGHDVYVDYTMRTGHAFATIAAT